MLERKIGTDRIPCQRQLRCYNISRGENAGDAVAARAAAGSALAPGARAEPTRGAPGVAEHWLAIIDPAPWDLAATAWWALCPDYGAPRDQPAIYFDPSGFTAPVLPIGGVTAAYG
jgi:hypothetical protein